LQKQDPERSLGERGDWAPDGMKKAEAFASECQMEPGKIRVENSEIGKLDARSLFIRLRWIE